MEDTVQELKRVVRRRKILLIVTPILFIGLSLLALQFIEPKYASSTTILVQEDGAFNPVLLYQMDMGMEEEDAANDLESFDNFINSRSTLEKLIDTLGLKSGDINDSGNRGIVEGLRSQITTSSGSSDSFELTFEDTDPERAKNAVEFLSNYYIETKKTLDSRRAKESVEYLSAKLSDLEQVIDQQRNEMVSSTSSRIKEQPVNTEALRARLQDINSQLETIDWQVFQEEDKEAYIQAFHDQNEENFSVQPLYRLPLEEIPYGDELASLLDRYDEMNQNYTESYPQLQSLRNRITEVVKRIPPAMESRKNRLLSQREDLSRQRSQIIENMEQSYVAEQQSSTKQTSYAVYQELYNEMKVKLEQAEFASELSERATGNFLVLDHPQIAEEPSSPNRNLILGASLLLGFIIGGFMITIAEVLDNTVRTEDDFPIDKPIIAYLSDGN
ncbi:MAG: Wzz/FepE/Etk N-terminal domain-containing protein [Balneolaceae bacterium]